MKKPWISSPLVARKIGWFLVVIFVLVIFPLAIIEPLWLGRFLAIVFFQGSIVFGLFWLVLRVTFVQQKDVKKVSRLCNADFWFRLLTLVLGVVFLSSSVRTTILDFTFLIKEKMPAYTITRIENITRTVATGYVLQTLFIETLPRESMSLMFYPWSLDKEQLYEVYYLPYSNEILDIRVSPQNATSSTELD